MRVLGFLDRLPPSLRPISGKEHARLTAEVAALRERVSELQREAARPPAVARDLVRVADRLVDLVSDTAVADPDRAARALRWLEGRLGTLLGAHEITPVDDRGPVDATRHEVVEVRAAPNPELADHIAETVRPGYAWRGTLFRPQQVIAYVLEKTDISGHIAMIAVPEDQGPTDGGPSRNHREKASE